MQIIENLCPHYNLSFLIFQFIISHDRLRKVGESYAIIHQKLGKYWVITLLPNTQKTLNYPIFIGNSRFFVDLHDNNTVQILMRTVRLCVHLSCNFSCKIFIFLFKTFTCLETNEFLQSDSCSVSFSNFVKVFSYRLFSVFSFYIYLI